MGKKFCFGVLSVLVGFLCACQVPTSSFEPPKCEHDLTAGEKYYGTWLSKEEPNANEQRKLVIRKYEILPEIMAMLDKEQKTPEQKKKAIEDFERECFNVSLQLQTFRKKVENPILEQTDMLPLCGFFFKADNKLFLCAGWDSFRFLLGKYDYTNSSLLFKPMYYTFRVTDLPEGMIRLEYVTFIEYTHSKDAKMANGTEEKKKTSPSLELYQDQVVLNSGDVVFRSIEKGEYKLVLFGNFIRQPAAK